MWVFIHGCGDLAIPTISDSLADFLGHEIPLNLQLIQMYNILIFVQRVENWFQFLFVLVQAQFVIIEIHKFNFFFFAERQGLD